MYGPPRYCNVFVDDAPACVNVSDRRRINGVGLVGFDKRLPKRAAMIRASCPIATSRRASHCEPGQASMPRLEQLGVCLKAGSPLRSDW